MFMDKDQDRITELYPHRLTLQDVVTSLLYLPMITEMRRDLMGIEIHLVNLRKIYTLSR